MKYLITIIITCFVIWFVWPHPDEEWQIHGVKTDKIAYWERPENQITFDSKDLKLSTDKTRTTALTVCGGLNKDLLRITGISVVYNQDWKVVDYPYPEKPEEVKIQICTQDGRKWKAKWEEVK